MKKWLFLCLLAACMMLISCQQRIDNIPSNEGLPSAEPTPQVVVDNKPTSEPVDEQEELEEDKDIDQVGVELLELQIAQSIMQYLANGQLTEVASFVAPDGKVRFSPYPYVLEDIDFELTAERLANAMDDSAIVTTREYDGSGEPMDLTFKQYYDQFINDRSYVTEAVVGVNTTNGLGAMIQNWQDVYPEDQYVSIEYYIEGTSEFEGMDWSSLRIVLEKSNTQFNLVAIIHGARTI